MFITSAIFSWNHMHPVLVHFTTALPVVSLASDLAGKFTERNSLTSAAWWTLVYGAVATPLTALAGFMWALTIERSGGADPAITTHQWLGFGLIAGLLLMTIWRGRIFYLAGKPGYGYIVFAGVILAALAYQGFLGGKMTLG
jgi:uncharacterized membrane protein